MTGVINPLVACLLTIAAIRPGYHELAATEPIRASADRRRAAGIRGHSDRYPARDASETGSADPGCWRQSLGCGDRQTRSEHERAMTASNLSSRRAFL